MKKGSSRATKLEEVLDLRAMTELGVPGGKVDKVGGVGPWNLRP